MKKSTDAGEYMNEIQIQRELGGTDSVESVRQATNYITQCQFYGPPFAVTNDWTKAENFLHIKHLVSNSYEKSWKDVVEQFNSYNLWELKAKECRARRNFAASFGLKVLVVLSA